MDSNPLAANLFIFAIIPIEYSPFFLYNKTTAVNQSARLLFRVCAGVLE